MCGNDIFSTSHYKVIQHKRAFLGESPEPKLRPCSRNENSENENKISHHQISKTVSIDLNIDRGETLNTKQKKIMVRNNFRNFYSANSTFLKFSIDIDIYIYRVVSCEYNLGIVLEINLLSSFYMKVGAFQ